MLNHDLKLSLYGKKKHFTPFCGTSVSILIFKSCFTEGHKCYYFSIEHIVNYTSSIIDEMLVSF